MQSVYGQVERGWDRVSRRVRLGCATAVLWLAWGGVAWSAPEPVTAGLVTRLAEGMRGRYPALVELEREVEAGRWNLKGRRHWADPELEAGGARYRTGEMARENGDVFYGVRQPLPIMGKEAATRSLAGAELTAAEARLEARFAELRRDLAVALLESALERELVVLTAEDVGWMESQLTQARVRLSTGSESAAQVLRLENELDRRRTEWTNAVAGLADAGVRVEQLLGEGAMTGTEGYAVPELGGPVAFGAALVRFAERAEPEVLRRERQIGVAQAEVEVTRRSGRPDFAVSAQAYHQTAGGTPAMGMLSVSMMVPLWNRENFRRDLRRDRDRLAGVEAAAGDARQAVRREVHGLVTRIGVARREALLQQDQVLPRTERLLGTLTAGWASGRMELRDLFDTRRQWLEARAMEARARAEYWVAVAELLLCCGLSDLDAVQQLETTGTMDMQGGTAR